MVLKPQDVFVALKLVALGGRRWTYAELSRDLFMSASEINVGVRRAIRARLLAPGTARGDNPRPVVMALEEFLIHGLKYAFPPDRGGLTTGILTSSSMKGLSMAQYQNEDLPPVWPAQGKSDRGYGFSPLYRSAPQAAESDSTFYELLALADAVRDDRCRSRNEAGRRLTRRVAALTSGS